ncbi:DEKNAAC104843 [Brettanomyces naardenensis]|uniref:Sorting nexin-4 n=1 Tax=Brettanomyces naardenensis TaxID=13370 RepID=A0A448YS07_BRENA|nr:DEKNAAC104843 [Brettanomyces naardenensis]
MSDQFTSVQWDKDEETTENTDNTASSIPEVQPENEEVGNDNSNEPLTHLEGDAEDDDNGTASEEADEDDKTDPGSGLITQEMLDAQKSSDGKEIREGNSENSKQSESLPQVETASLADEEPAPVPQPGPALQAESEYSKKPVELENTKTNTDYPIETSVEDPLTEHDVQNTYITYQITVRSRAPNFPDGAFQTRRRYSDFYFLYECLINDFPTLLVPPLPNKQRLEYIKGGRFSDEFTKKRSISLSNFLHRVCKHPILRKSDVLHIFLADTDQWNTYKANLKVPSVGSIDATNSASQNLETVTEFIMNSFKKPTVETQNKKEFQEIQDKTTKLQESLGKIDHIYGKVLHRQQSIADDMSKFGEEFGNLTLLLNNNLEGKHQELEDLDDDTNKMVKQFKNFASNLTQISEGIYNLDHKIEYNYLTALKDLEHYILQLKNLMKLKDAKALDYEMLSNYSEKTKQERNHLINGGSITSSAEGTLSFLTRKLESIAGIGANNQSGNLTNDRIEKLTARIDVLEAEKDKADKIYHQYQRDIVTEFQFFNQIKDEEISSSLKDLANYYLDFYSKAAEEMKEFDADVETKSGLFENQLTKDGKLFSNNEVQKNSLIIADNLQKIEDMSKK